MRRAGYSLASILLLTVVVAIFAAAIGTLMVPPRRVEPALIVAGAILGLVAGIVVGVTIGLRQMRPVSGVVWGLCSGMLAGLASGMLLAVPNSLPVIAVGSLVMLVFAVVVRFFSR